MNFHTDLEGRKEFRENNIFELQIHQTSQDESLLTPLIPFSKKKS